LAKQYDASFRIINPTHADDDYLRVVVVCRFITMDESFLLENRAVLRAM
jgi:hypothetical protein